MISTSGQERRADAKSQLMEQLHDPVRLRFIVAAAVLGIAYAAVYLPLDRGITAATRQLADSKKRLSLADDVQQLRKQYKSIEKRLPKRVDADEWVQYVLAAIRRSPLAAGFLQSRRRQAARTLPNGLPLDQVVRIARRSGQLRRLVGIEPAVVSRGERKPRSEGERRRRRIQPGHRSDGSNGLTCRVGLSNSHRRRWSWPWPSTGVGPR